jgi:hypothetical protein
MGNNPFANLQFQPGWNEVLIGDLAQGGQLKIDYDPARLTGCRRYHGGMPAWDIWGYVRLHPNGPLYKENMVRHLDGTPPKQQVLDPPMPKPLEVSVPIDATQVELWFNNTDIIMCSAWDSRFGHNYWYDVSPRGPAQQVSYRTGAIPSLEMVNVFTVEVSKRNVFPQSSTGARIGSDLQTQLRLKAWVRNVAYTKNVWIDVHVFDGADTLTHSETLTLHYLEPAGGNGDFFSFDGKMDQGGVATPGSVSPRPDARKVQFRLYSEMNNQVFTDAILHQFELPEDALV